MNPEASITEVPEQKIIKSSPSHLIFLFLVILGVAVVSALGTYYYLQSSTPTLTPQYQQATDQSNTNVDTLKKDIAVNQSITGTEGWKTYQGKTYTFRYPSEWVLVDDNGTQRIYLDKQSASLNTPNFIVFVNTFDKKLLKITFDDPVGTKKETADKVFTTKVGTLTIDNQEAFKSQVEVLSGSQTEASPSIAVYINLGDQVLTIDMDLSKNANSNLKIFDQILSTFKFSN